MSKNILHLDRFAIDTATELIYFVVRDITTKNHFSLPGGKLKIKRTILWERKQ